MNDGPLRTALLDLHDALDPVAGRVLLGGGYGLYLKQLHLRKAEGRTLLDAAAWPAPRVTNDLDLLLPAEPISDAADMTLVRRAPNRLGTGEAATRVVRVSHTLSCLLMKLTAYRDRRHDARRDLGRHDAMDLYRIIAIASPGEDAEIPGLTAAVSDDPVVAGRQELVSADFSGRAAPRIAALRARRDWPGTPDAGATIDLFYRGAVGLHPPGINVTGTAAAQRPRQRLQVRPHERQAPQGVGPTPDVVAGEGAAAEAVPQRLDRRVDADLVAEQEAVGGRLRRRASATRSIPRSRTTAGRPAAGTSATAAVRKRAAGVAHGRQVCTRPHRRHRPLVRRGLDRQEKPAMMTTPWTRPGTTW